MCLLFYSAGFDWGCNISPDVSLTHKLASILLWWTSNKCLKIALVKCQCYHGHGINQKTNVYVGVTLCKTHFERWIWSVIVLLPRPSSSDGRRSVLVCFTWFLINTSPAAGADDMGTVVPEKQSSASSVGQGVPSAQPCERRGAAMPGCAAGFFPLGNGPGDTSPAAGGEPWASLCLCGFFWCQRWALSQCQCRWLKDELGCPCFVLLVIHSCLMEFCNPCTGM